jgi:hypothetical protein
MVIVAAAVAHTGAMLAAGEWEVTSHGGSIPRVLISPRSYGWVGSSSDQSVFAEAVRLLQTY